MNSIIRRIAVLLAVVALVIVAASSASAAYTRDLTLGSTGSDVVELQTFLESKGFLVIPAGVSKGYFGAMTQSALAKYQASKGITPATGYFGPLTRAAVAAEGSVATPTTPSSSNTLSGDEASLEAFDFSAGDDDNVKEGDSAEIAEIEFDVEDGDIEINRVDLKLVADNANEEEDPWDTFESLSLLIDGKEVGEVDLSDEDEYLDEDEGEIRISNINYVVKEGKTVTIVVAVEAQSSVDGADTGDSNWTISVLDDGIRATDAKGLDQYVGDDSEEVDFEVVGEGEDDELDVSSSKNDPESTTLKVEDDKKSDEHTIFIFNVETDETDVELDTVTLNIETGTADVNDVVSDLILDIDGEQFDDWEFVDVDNGATTTATVEFDIDGDFTIDADTEIEIALIAEFKAANGSNYASTGETVQASIGNAGIEGEGGDDVDSDGTASGEEHELSIAGIIVDESGFSDEGSSTNNDEGTSRDYEFSFEVTAFEEDFYIATSSISVFVEGAGAATSSFTVDSTGDEDIDGVFTVEEGETEVFTVVVTISEVAVSGQYRVGLNSVDYTENSDGVTGAETKDVLNSDFRTAYKTVNAI